MRITSIRPRRAERAGATLSRYSPDFFGDGVTRLIEDVLPASFGGDATDYQLVEREAAEGLPRVDLVVHPRVGPIDEERAIGTVLDHLGGGTGALRLQSHLLRGASVLSVLRRGPHATQAGKVLTLHVLHDDRLEN